MKNLILPLFLLLLSSCVDDSTLVENSSTPFKISPDGTILVFNSFDEFNQLIKEDSIHSRTNNILTEINNFESILSVFKSAMINAEKYYDTESNYRKFKELYSSLYFPETGDDYSAYLPVSSEVIAKYLNKNCEVQIGKVVYNFRNIFCYEDLEKYKLTPPSNNPQDIFPKKILGDTETNCIYSSDKTRKVWVQSRQETVYVASDNLHIKVCFRKKGFLGLWYNYDSQSSIKGAYSYIGYYLGSDKKYHEINYTLAYERAEAGWSPHNYNQSVASPASHVVADFIVHHRGLDEDFRYTNLLSVNLWDDNPNY